MRFFHLSGALVKHNNKSNNNNHRVSVVSNTHACRHTCLYMFVYVSDMPVHMKYFRGIFAISQIYILMLYARNESIYIYSLLVL